MSLLINNMLPSRFISFNLTLQRGDTALLLAAGGGHYEVFKFLVREGADIKGKDKVSP